VSSFIDCDHEMAKLFFSKTSRKTWDWLAAFLLIILLQIAAARLVTTLWTPDLNLVMVVTFFGTILGLMLGRSIFKRIWVFLLALTYGTILVTWQLGLTIGPEIRWHDRLVDLWGRLNLVIQELLNHKAITDNLLFLCLMAVLFYALSIYSGVVLVRETNPWKVIIPGGVAAFVINSFDALLTVRSLYLAVYLLVALFMISRLAYLKNTVKWSDTHTHTSPDIGFELSRVALVVSLVVVLFAWNLPVVAGSIKPVASLWQATSRPWLSLKDHFSFMFASLRSSASTVQNYYSDTLSLGLGSQLGDSVVMEVVAPTSPPSGTRYYWEARAYDTYNNYIWSSSLQDYENLSGGSKDLNQPGVDLRPKVTFIFSPYQTITNIFSVPEILWTSLPTRAYMENNTDGTVNLSALISKSNVRPGEQYTVRSAMDAVTIKQLKEAGTDYPLWVLSEDLQLPDDITPRTKELAVSITQGLTTTYDIANAVTQYLRTNIQYDQAIDAPPARQERIDWFLFDYQKGFCNYYASAEVVLLRSVGIPARLAVGFAQGERQPGTEKALPAGSSVYAGEPQTTSSVYLVRQKDAHAWPEVYFPNIGWVIFEPTVSQSTLSRPSGEPIASDLSLADRLRSNPVDHQELGSERQLPTDDGSTSTAPKSFWTTGNIILFIFAQFALGAILIIAWQLMRGFRFYTLIERISISVPETIERLLIKLGIPPPVFLTSWIYYMKLPPTSRSYMEINHALERIGKMPNVNDTPAERAAALATALPSAAGPVQWLLAEYQTSIYSRHGASAEIARKAAAEIRSLSRRESLRQFLARIRLSGSR
jgi:transglutaminase-like putative cysteine protease